MSVRMMGRALVGVGLVIGLLATSLPVASGARYADDGTALAFLIICLSLSSWVPAELGNPMLDRLAAVLGSAAFGFFLFVPARFAFDQLGYLGSGAWLGLCTVLIPIGTLIAWSKEDGLENPALKGQAAFLPAAGLILALVGVWLPIGGRGDDTSYWDLSSSGHALGLLTLLVIVLNIAVLGGLFRAVPSGTGLLLAAVSFGLFNAAMILSVLNDFGALGAGGWIEAIGGIFLLVGVARAQVSTAPGHASVPAADAAP